MDPLIDAQAFARTLRRPLGDLPDPLAIAPLPEPFNADITPPGSKSLTNRAILLAALADGESTLRRPLTDADDAQRMLRAVEQLGAAVDASDPAALRITGVGGRPRGGVELDLGNAGTAIRFLAAAAILADGPITLTGNERMRQRPIGQLAVALEALGARVEHLGVDGCPPLRITPPAERTLVSELSLPRAASSQFISALLMIAPWRANGLTLRLDEGATSAPYIAMTMRLLDRLGGAGLHATPDLESLRVGAGPLAGFDYEIEPDASGATYFWAAAALSPRSAVRVHGLSADSLQGDARFPSLLAAMGAVTGSTGAVSGVTAPPGTTGGRQAQLAPIRADLSAMPDAALTLAVLCCFASGPSELGGLRTLRVKETDRLEALRTELTRLGAEVEIFTDAGAGDGDEGLRITPPSDGGDVSIQAPKVVLETYDDHRLAMSLALAGLRRPNTWIRDPACVAKTYPGFWADFALLYESPASDRGL